MYPAFCCKTFISNVLSLLCTVTYSQNIHLRRQIYEIQDLFVIAWDRLSRLELKLPEYSLDDISHTYIFVNIQYKSQVSLNIITYLILRHMRDLEIFISV